nr:MAG TPA: tail protein [Caudoviricetes sp.]
MMKLWKQVRLITIGEIVFDYDELDVEFEVKCTDDNKSDLATIKLYNLSDTTLQKLKLNQDVSIDAGYRELHGVIFNGIVESISTSRDENDFITTIEATPNNRAYANTIINRQFKAGIKASEVIKQIETMCNFTMDIKELGKDTVYPNGKVFSGRLSNVIPILARDTGTICRFTNTTIEFKLPNKAYSSVLHLGGEQGLIRIDKKMDKADIKEKKGPQVESKNKSNVDKKISKSKFDIECLLVPLIKIGQLLEIDSTLFKGQVVVKECSFVASGLESFTVSASVEVV